MIIWTPSISLLGTVTKPNIVNYSISAVDDTIPTPIVLNWYSVTNISSNLPKSIILSASNSGATISGNTSESFGNGKQMDYALPNGILGTATKIIDIPKNSYLYNYHVDPRISETYTFTVNVYSLVGLTFNPLVDTIISSMNYQIICMNSWDSNKIDILNILSKNY